MTEKNIAFAGFKLKGLRINKQYSLAETAKHLDITTSYLSLIENGKKSPSKKVLSKASDLFEVSIDTFYENPKLLEDLEELTKSSDLSEIIQAFEIILREKS
ncbi:DNA-binding transcriptional regulator, XRE-family HTH domain [Vibrio xiamenensis]|uniref:DNA-binding transcriptional regulator, XRE-family HTH domain n=1 Tax=Vibrio xiamenensis TaxID=861298 RepID=A0A1G8HHK6_9VIBR|nr:helix-turn-helix transcriptional regulator [Vibrio xiamenensis]SDI06021.1 DNA-binding transcriptional regulator, XRE-family HTH domain [Vibrio xiamenensis]